MEFYDPAEVGIEDLVKRTRVGYQTREFISTPTGSAMIGRALSEYRKGIETLQKMAMKEWRGSPDKELAEYRALASNLATPVKILKWIDNVIADGENAESISKYRGSGEFEP